ncbi:MAG: DinB family protein [Pseudomonadota bacterium]
MKAHFEMMAAYNAWANARLYDAAASLSDDDYRRDVGAFFKSMHGTLNHLFSTDVIWMSRFRGKPNPPWTLDHTPHDDLGELRARRKALDHEIQGWVMSLAETEMASEISYTTITGPAQVSQPLAEALAHFFNHQTHHRGQCHGILTHVGAEAPPLDLLLYQRES